MPPLPASAVQWLGLLVVFVTGTALVSIVQNSVKSFMFKRNGHERRRNDDAIVSQLIEALRETNNEMAGELRNFAGVVANLDRHLTQRAEKALVDHRVILEKIDDLDVPRRSANGD